MVVRPGVCPSSGPRCPMRVVLDVNRFGWGVDACSCSPSTGCTVLVIVSFLSDSHGADGDQTAHASGVVAGDVAAVLQGAGLIEGVDQAYGRARRHVYRVRVGTDLAAGHFPFACLLFGRIADDKLMGDGAGVRISKATVSPALTVMASGAKRSSSVVAIVMLRSTGRAASGAGVGPMLIPGIGVGPMFMPGMGP